MSVEQLSRPISLVYYCSGIIILFRVDVIYMNQVIKGRHSSPTAIRALGGIKIHVKIVYLSFSIQPDLSSTPAFSIDFFHLNLLCLFYCLIIYRLVWCDILNSKLYYILKTITP